MNKAAEDTVTSLYKKYSSQLLPVQTSQTPVLPLLPIIDTVLFDVYGTLVISSSGDVGTTATDSSASAFAEIFTTETGLDLPDNADINMLVKDEILKSHGKSREKGIKFPEVEIRDIWKNIFAGLNRDYDCNLPVESKTVRIAAVAYELSRNRVWPMPGSASLLKHLKSSGIELGIISNAQFYTPQMLNCFFPLETSFFPEKNCIWSYIEGRGKPDTQLFQKFLTENTGKSPEQILYVGNDMLNDIYTAAECGMKTALFAGDQRSLRLRENDPRTKNITPDAVLTSLDQLLTVLGIDNRCE